MSDNVVVFPVPSELQSLRAELADADVEKAGGKEVPSPCKMQIEAKTECRASMAEERKRFSESNHQV